MSELLSGDDLGGFVYPPEFERVVALGLVDLEPWRILVGEDLRETAAGLRKRYSDQNYVPFAARVDNDDIACWRMPSSGEVVIVHDFASPGWEARGRGHPDVMAWFRQAVDDCIEWGKLEAEFS
ncbi:MAG: hypothetical protein JO291_07675 [Acidimicrobiia bacterium]|nr:hypothetical protein [Acidimicrobiia bacterium]